MAAAFTARGRLIGWFESYRSALARRDLRLLLGALAVSSTGSWAVNVALLAFVFNRTHSFGWVAAAGATRYLAALILSPYGGVIAERSERIRLMVSSDLASFACQAAAAVVAAVGGPVLVVLALAALTTVTNIVYSPAVAATIPSVVDEDDLVAANALNDTINNLVVIAGPAIGAGLLVVGTPALGFAVNAGSFAVSAAVVSRIRIRTKPAGITEDASGPLHQMTVGARTIFSLPEARTLVGFSALVSFVYGTDTVLFVAVSTHKLGTGSRGYGYLLAGLGIGGIVMAAAVDRLARSAKLAPLILGGALGYCLPTALLVIIHDPALAFALQIVRGGSTLVVDVLAVTALQRAVPGERLARVFGIYFGFVLAAIASGTVLAPVIIAAAGLNGALMVVAFGPAAIALLASPSLVSIDRRTEAQTAALAPRVTVLEQLEIFATASRTVLERLARSAAQIEFSAGSTIVREGDPADALYVLVAGEVEVTARGELGSERAIRTMSAPSYFGEIGVLQHIPRTATVKAVSVCRCERIEGQALLDALTTTPVSSSLMENARSRLAVTHPSLVGPSPTLGV